MKSTIRIQTFQHFLIGNAIEGAPYSDFTVGLRTVIGVERSPLRSFRGSVRQMNRYGSIGGTNLSIEYDEIITILAHGKLFNTDGLGGIYSAAGETK